MLEGQQLVVGDQAPERLLDQLLAFTHVVEHAWPHDEEAAVHPHVGFLRGPETLHEAGLVEVHHMQAERRPHGKECRSLAALPEARDQLVHVGVGQAVAVVGEKHLLAFDLLAHGPQPLADIAPQAGIDQRHTPILLGIAEHLDVAVEPGHDAVRERLRPVGEKELLDDVRLVAQAQDEVLVAVLAIVVHQVP